MTTLMPVASLARTQNTHTRLLYAQQVNTNVNYKHRKINEFAKPACKQSPSMATNPGTHAASEAAVWGVHGDHTPAKLHAK